MTDATDPSWIRDRYDRLAPFYDLLANPLHRLARAHTRKAIDQLRLQHGDTVVVLGVGTGAGLDELAERVGADGHVIGVDLSGEMLQRAQARARRRGYGDRFVAVQGDMRRVELPPDTAGVIALFSVEMLTDHARLLRRLCDQLAPGTRIVFAGLRNAVGWPEWLARLGVLLTRVFGVRPQHRDLKPWRPLLDMLDDQAYREAFGGAAYLAAGTVPQRWSGRDTGRRAPR